LVGNMTGQSGQPVQRGEGLRAVHEVHRTRCRAHRY
jgi:hypothetical protein